MYDNISGTIKGLAKALVIIETIVGLILAIALSAETDGDAIPFAVLLVFVVPIFAWMFSLPLYGLGELIEKVNDIERNTHDADRKSKAQGKEEAERIEKIERLRAQGLITEEEYQRTMKKGV